MTPITPSLGEVQLLIFILSVPKGLTGGKKMLLYQDHFWRLALGHTERRSTSKP